MVTWITVQITWMTIAMTTTTGGVVTIIGWIGIVTMVYTVTICDTVIDMVMVTCII